MQVYELIEFLENCDPEAEVLLGEQPNYPFEYSVDAVIKRSDFVEQRDEDTGETLTDEQKAELYTGGKNANDVILLEGSQIRYASKKMWDCY